MSTQRKRGDVGYDPFLDSRLSLWLFDHGVAKYVARMVFIVLPVLFVVVMLALTTLVWAVESYGPLVLIVPAAGGVWWAWKDPS